MLTGLLSLAVPSAQKEATATPYVLKWQPKVGVTKYSFTCELSSEGRVRHNFTGTERDEILKLSSGTFITQVSRKWIDDKYGDAGPGDASLIKFKADGSVAAENTSDHDYFDEETRRLTDLVFPGKPVAVGDAWKRAAEWSGLPAFATTYKLDGIEKLDGVDAFRITVSGRETTGENKIKADGILWIEKASGTVVKKQLTISYPYTLNYGFGSQVDLKLEFVRQASSGDS